MEPAIIQETPDLQERPNPGRKKKRKEDSEEEMDEPELPDNTERRQYIQETKDIAKENTTGRPMRSRRQPIRYKA